MSGLTSFVVSSEETAARTLDYFNGFHDGFMKRIVLESQDRINEDLSQTCTGMFDVEIDFAHYNYAKGAEPFHPHNQMVSAEFRNVQDILAEFRDGFLGNTIISLSITSVNRRRAGQLATEHCLGLSLARHYYLEDQRRYELRESQLFTFTDATFFEQPSAGRRVG
jgi:hypothetical protein